jgi:hypothetical protein
VRTRVQLAVVAFIVATAAALGSSSALAAIQIEDSSVDIDATGLGITLLSEGGFVNPEVTCAFELNGDLEGVIEVEEVIGDTDTVSFFFCSGGTITAGAQSIDLRLEDFFLVQEDLGAGLILAEDIDFSVTISGVTCDFGGPLHLTLPALGEPLLVSRLEVNEQLTLTDTGGSILCPPRGGLSGSLGLDPTLPFDLI